MAFSTNIKEAVPRDWVGYKVSIQKEIVMISWWRLPPPYCRGFSPYSLSSAINIQTYALVHWKLQIETSFPQEQILTLIILTYVVLFIFWHKVHFDLGPCLRFFPPAPVLAGGRVEVGGGRGSQGVVG